MPSKKRKYNARFPAGRIKKIMQTDEEVGKVAQAVPIIISRTLELFVESLLKKALQVTSARNAKTLSPSHVKQCILAETRFDFLRDLVKNIPDVSAAEERELMSAETSPNTSRFPDAPRKVAREDSNSSSSCDVTRSQPITSNVTSSREHLKRALSTETEIPFKAIKTEPGTSIIIDPLAPSTSVKIEPYSLVPSTTVKIEPLVAGITVHNDAPMDLHMSPVLAKIKHKILSKELPPLKIVEDTAIDLSKKETPRIANFYQETLVDDVSHSSVIKVNPTYLTPQPSTSFTTLTPVDTRRKVEFPFERRNSIPRTPATPKTPITPVINIDFSKNLARPEIKVLDAATSTELTSALKNEKKQVSRQNSKSRIEVKKIEAKPVPIPVDIDSLNSGNLQIDEDYDA